MKIIKKGVLGTAILALVTFNSMESNAAQQRHNAMHINARTSAVEVIEKIPSDPEKVLQQVRKNFNQIIIETRIILLNTIDTQAMNLSEVTINEIDKHLNITFANRIIEKLTEIKQNIITGKFDIGNKKEEALRQSEQLIFNITKMRDDFSKLLNECRSFIGNKEIKDLLSKYVIQISDAYIQWGDILSQF